MVVNICAMFSVFVLLKCKVTFKVKIITHARDGKSYNEDLRDVD